MRPTYHTKPIERLAYPMFGIGQTLIFGFIGQFLALFFTDTLALPAAAVSAIFLAAKIWDAVNDPLFGGIVDRVTFRKNKFKPWLKFTAFAVPLFTVLLFQISPDWSMPVKIGLAAGGYVLWSMIYTVSDVPSFSLMVALTPDNRERTALLSYNSVAGALAAILLVVVFAPQLEKLGFAAVALIIGVVACPLLILYPVVAKERNRPVSDAPRHGLKDIFRYLKANKFLTIFYLSFCLNGVLNVSLTLTNYVMIYCLGGLKYLAIFTAIGVGPLIVLYLLIPRIAQKVDRMTLYKICLISSAVLSVVTYFVGYGNIYAYGALAILRTVIATPSTLLVATFTTDCIEYGHYKTGLRKEGLTFSLQTFANKLNNAVASSLGMALLAVVGYQSGADVQTVSTLSGLWFTANLVPVIGVLLSLPLLHFYKLKGRDAQIMTDINAGLIDRAEGEEKMSRKYT